MPASLTVHAEPGAVRNVDTLVIVGRASRLMAEDVIDVLPPGVSRRVWARMIKGTDPGDHGRATTTWCEGRPARVTAAVLPEPCSRHNSTSRSHAIPALLKAAGQHGNTGIVLAVDTANHAFPATLAAARALPTFTASSSRVERRAELCVLAPDEGVPEPRALQIAAEAVRFAADLVDRPPDVLGVDAFVEAARQVSDRIAGVGCQVLRGEELRRQGLGALYAVGRAARQTPALVVLDYAPDNPSRRVSWVGKGIVYDTGGLSLKTKTGMPGMKTDMGGAAAVLSAFGAAARLGTRHRLTAVLCIAENAIGPDAIRPDDVIHAYSGKTIEVNNTDAEGRLVLADGVAWAARHRDPEVLVDMATLTGAQATATGKLHAALYCSAEELEQVAVRAGRASGDLCHPVPYAPELFRKEFRSPIADMRNSVKDRQNAQASCAGQFIGNHLSAVGYREPWLHVDMAAPAVHAHRGTGWGVGLLLTLAGVGAPLS